MKIPNYLLFSCADSEFNHFSKILQDTINDRAPIKYIRIKGNTKPWLDGNMIGLIRKRDFKEQRNTVQRENKRNKGNYVKE